MDLFLHAPPIQARRCLAPRGYLFARPHLLRPLPAAWSASYTHIDSRAQHAASGPCCGLETHGFGRVTTLFTSGPSSPAACFIPIGLITCCCFSNICRQQRAGERAGEGARVAGEEAMVVPSTIGFEQPTLMQPPDRNGSESVRAAALSFHSRAPPRYHDPRTTSVYTQYQQEALKPQPLATGQLLSGRVPWSLRTSKLSGARDRSPRSLSPNLVSAPRRCTYRSLL